MIKIRQGTFETNSSSTHSIAIPKTLNNDRIPSSISAHLDEFGWSFEQVDPIDYLYTAVTELDEYYHNGLTKKFYDLLVANNISINTYTRNSYYIDHCSELNELITKLLSDNEMFLKYLSGALVFTGNDNCDDDQYCRAHRNKEMISDSKYNNTTKKWEEYTYKNPYYLPEYENYDWYWKGN